MDSNMINIDDLVRQRLGGGEEQERSGAWLRMQELLEQDKRRKPIGFFYWKKAIMFVGALLLLAALSLGGYEATTVFRNPGNAAAAMASALPSTGANNAITAAAPVAGSAGAAASAVENGTTPVKTGADHEQNTSTIVTAATTTTGNMTGNATNNTPAHKGETRITKDAKTADHNNVANNFDESRNDNALPSNNTQTIAAKNNTDRGTLNINAGNKNSAQQSSMTGTTASSTSLNNKLTANNKLKTTNKANRNTVNGTKVSGNNATASNTADENADETIAAAPDNKAVAVEHPSGKATASHKQATVGNGANSSNALTALATPGNTAQHKASKKHMTGIGATNNTAAAKNTAAAANVTDLNKLPLSASVAGTTGNKAKVPSNTTTVGGNNATVTAHKKHASKTGNNNNAVTSDLASATHSAALPTHTSTTKSNKKAHAKVAAIANNDGEERTAAEENGSATASKAVKATKKATANTAAHDDVAVNNPTITRKHGTKASATKSTVATTKTAGTANKMDAGAGSSNTAKTNTNIALAATTESTVETKKVEKIHIKQSTTGTYPNRTQVHLDTTSIDESTVSVTKNKKTSPSKTTDAATEAEPENEYAGTVGSGPSANPGNNTGTPSGARKSGKSGGKNGGTNNGTTGTPTASKSGTNNNAKGSSTAGANTSAGNNANGAVASNTGGQELISEPATAPVVPSAAPPASTPPPPAAPGPKAPDAPKDPGPPIVKKKQNHFWENLSAKFNDMRVNLSSMRCAPGLTAGINSTFFGPNSFKGFQFGVTAAFEIDEKWSFFTELKYFQRMNNDFEIQTAYNKYTLVDPNNPSGGYHKDSVDRTFSFSTLHSFELPVSLRYKAGKLNFFAGGNFLYTFAVNTGAGDQLHNPYSRPVVASIGNASVPTLNTEDFSARFGIGYLFGFAYQVAPNVMLDLRSAQTFWDNSKSASAKLVSSQLYNSPSVQFSIQYRLGAKKTN